MRKDWLVLFGLSVENSWLGGLVIRILIFACFGLNGSSRVSSWAGLRVFFQDSLRWFMARRGRGGGGRWTCGEKFIGAGGGPRKKIGGGGARNNLKGCLWKGGGKIVFLPGSTTCLNGSG